MSIIYVSALCSKRIETEVLSVAPTRMGLQIQKYHRLFAKGFARNGEKTVALSYHYGAENAVPLPDSESEDGIEYAYIKSSGIGGFRHVSVLVRAFLKTNKLLKENPDAFVVCDVLNLSISLGALLAALIAKREIVGIVTDFPDMVTSSPQAGGPYWWLIRHCTSYVLLTEAMRERISTEGKKYIVLEGHVDKAMSETEERATAKWPGIHCIYAGGLHRKYGIEKLVKAFCLADVANATLHIYGDGDYAQELRNLHDARIVYHGIAQNDEVVQAELHAAVLINPRPTDEEFTRYSFPSKNMEYMASGTPVLTTNLPGMPDEYRDYVYLFDDESIEGMAQTLRQVLSKPEQELSEMGRRARHFVLSRKNNVVQAKKVIEMITGMNG